MPKVDQSAVTNVFKIVLVGEVRVGKTTLRMRYLGEGFRSDYLSTLGADFALKRYKTYEIQIWDLAGQPNFLPLLRHYYLGADGLVLVFDVTREESMEKLSFWIDEVNNSLNRKIPVIIVGNKIDLRIDTPGSITTELAKEHVKTLEKKYQSKFTYVETSALTGENINIAFEKLIDEILLLIRNSE